MVMNGGATGNQSGLDEYARIPALPDPDAYFSMLSDACRDLDAAQGHLFHAQLVLVLIHHIADPDIVQEAIAIARTGLGLPAISSQE
ncbi:DUF2783 domain-containing protein [Burkholderia stabilis]|uniref:DUF2783 domain-containing protein n=1 Tax=Burkholderia stabilis TaxID=95485 RepID=A0AAJ5N8W1_9BURK|nr:DUF2783 domain-containing protein [Burkholderia stabilis]VBB13961.1 Protein of unknown function (DUF2783) [Burkholderia stabilis]